MRLKVASVALAALALVGITAAGAQARQDTTWGCPGCVTTHHR